MPVPGENSSNDIGAHSFFITLYLLMDSSFWFDAINLGWSIVYIEESQVTISILFKTEIVFVLANSVDHDEMLHNGAFHPSLLFLPKYPFWGFWFPMG